MIRPDLTPPHMRLPLISARLKYWTWQLFSKPGLGVLYVQVIADGLRYLVPALGQKIYKIPGLSFLQDYEETYRLDLAPFFAIFLLIAVFSLWSKVLWVWLSQHTRMEAENELGWNPAAHALLVMSLGCVILGADACLFYVSMSQMSWSGTAFSVPALLATVAYVAVLIFVSFVSITLQKNVTDLERGK